MRSYDLISPEGTRDLILGDCAVIREVEKNLHEIFRKGGYTEVITPGLEFYDVFNQKSRYFPQETMYKLTDTKGRLLVVRPDSTMPIARVVSTRLRDKALPIRLYYSQNVFRSKPSMRGRSDEIRQTGIELIGSASRTADLEVLYKAIEALNFCGKDSFRLEIGHIGYFKEILRSLGTDSETNEHIRSLIETKNYPALGDLLDDSENRSAAAALKTLPRLFGGAEVIDEAEELFPNEETKRVLTELRSIFESISSLGYEDKITVDLGLVNRMDYYTGIVIKGYLHGFGDAVLSGGRYDKLISEYGFDVPATGFAVNVDAAAKVLRNGKDYTPRSADVLVFAEKGCEARAVKYSAELSENKNIIAENFLSENYDAAVSYAHEKNIKEIVVVGAEIKTVKL